MTEPAERLQLVFRIVGRARASSSRAGGGRSPVSGSLQEKRAVWEKSETGGEI